MMEESGQTSPMKAQLCHIVDVADTGDFQQKESSSTSFRSRDLRVTNLWALRAIPAAPCCFRNSDSTLFT